MGASRPAMSESVSPNHAIVGPSGKSSNNECVLIWSHTHRRDRHHPIVHRRFLRYDDLVKTDAARAMPVPPAPGCVSPGMSINERDTSRSAYYGTSVTRLQNY